MLNTFHVNLVGLNIYMKLSKFENPSCFSENTRRKFQVELSHVADQEDLKPTLNLLVLAD